MAQRVVINHAIFDTFSYQRGAEPVFDQGRKSRRQLDLESFLQHGDGVLDRDIGYFFGPVQNRFVIAVESQRTDDLSRKQTMYYFDVFWTNFDAIRDVHLTELMKNLRGFTSQSFNTNIKSKIELELQTYSDYIPHEGNIADVNQNQNADYSSDALRDQSENEFVDAREHSVNAESSDSDSGPSGFDSVDTVGQSDATGNSQETQHTNNPRNRTSKRSYSNDEPNTTFISQFWEQWRHPDEQLESKIVEIDRFNYAVSDAHQNLSFVSNERKINKTFDIVGGEFEYTLNTQELEEQVATLQKEQKLSCEHLPTYSDEVREAQQEVYKNLKEKDFFSNSVDEIMEDIETEIETSIGAVQNQSAETFWKACTDDWDDDDRMNSLIGEVTNVVGLSGNKNDPDYVSQLSADTVSDESIDRIVDDIVRDEIAGSLNAEREKIIQQLDRQIEQLEKDIRKRLVKGIINHIDQIKSSEAYQHAKKEDGTVH